MYYIYRMTVIERIYYRHGDVLPDSEKSKNIITKRVGFGNYLIQRENFTQSSPKARSPKIDFKSGFGNRGNNDVNLSDKTLGELFAVDVDDPNDKLWLDEKERLILKYEATGLSPAQIKIELLSLKPLGRDQRKIRQTNNIGTSSLSFTKKLEEIEEEIRQNRIYDNGKLVVIENQLNSILSSSEDIGKMTFTQLNELVNLLETLNIPKNYEELNLPRLIGISYYNSKAGIINMFLLKNAEYDSIVSLDRPVYGVRDDNSITLNSMVTSMSRSNNRLYLDLENRKILTKEMVIRIVNNITGGVDNPSVQITYDELNGDVTMDFQSPVSNVTTTISSPPSFIGSPERNEMINELINKITELTTKRNKINEGQGNSVNKNKQIYNINEKIKTAKSQLAELNKLN
jgi:hypothetical protein